MGSDTVVGFVLAVVAGITTGSFAAPMATIMKTWDWAHMWLIQTVFALLLLPWIVAATTTEGMADSMAEAKGSTFAALIGFGSVWGLGQVTFGISQDLVGVSLTYALVMGTLATMGTLLPMLVYTPEDFATVSGAFTLAGLVVIVVGLVLVSKAGRLKELALQQRAGDQDAGDIELATSNATSDGSGGTGATIGNASATATAMADTDAPKADGAAVAAGTVGNASPSGGNGGGGGGGGGGVAVPVPWYKTFAFGMVVCIFSGVSAPILNFGYIEGEELGDLLQNKGTSKYSSSNPSLAIILSSGSIWNLAFPIYLICKGNTWGKFMAPGLKTVAMNIALCFVMACLFYSGFSLFGAASILIGDLGPSIGWAVWITVLIIAGNVVGILNGDWQHAKGRPFNLLLVSLAIQTGAIFLSALGIMFQDD